VLGGGDPWPFGYFKEDSLIFYIKDYIPVSWGGVGVKEAEEEEEGRKRETSG